MTVTASNFALKKNEFYETEPWATEALVRALKLLHLWDEGVIWEPAAGNHAIACTLLGSGAVGVITSDIATYNTKHNFMLDFIGAKSISLRSKFNIVTNPPYGRGNRMAVKFAEQSLDFCKGYVALLLTAKFDFGSSRTHLFRDNPRFLAKVNLMDRISWAGNGQVGTEDHAWYIWGPRGIEVSNPRLLYESNLNKKRRSPA